MSSLGSMSMDISSDDTEYETCPTNLMADAMSSGYDYDNVRDYKRSRFDEAESYKQVGHVGSGGYGNCLLLQKRSNMALRVCKIQRRSKRESEPLEVKILRDFLPDHPRIVRLHEVVFHATRLQLYFDWYPGGDLFKMIAFYREAWEMIPESFIWHCFLQLSEALTFIHHGFDRREMCEPPPASEWQSIIHGDIKPENIFLGPPTPDSHGYPSLVLGDFGLARLDERPVCGTWMWQPPEMPMTSKKADVWALGAVMHALAHGGRPPLRARPEGMPHHIFYQSPEARRPTSLLGIYNTELHDLVIHGALQFDPRIRPSSMRILECVLIEVELGGALEECEPLLPADYLSKTYDEYGVTEQTTVSSEEKVCELDWMKPCVGMEPTMYHVAEEYTTAPET